MSYRVADRASSEVIGKFLCVLGTVVGRTRSPAKRVALD